MTMNIIVENLHFSVLLCKLFSTIFKIIKIFIVIFEIFTEYLYLTFLF